MKKYVVIIVSLILTGILAVIFSYNLGFNNSSKLNNDENKASIKTNENDIYIIDLNKSLLNRIHNIFRVFPRLERM